MPDVFLVSHDQKYCTAYSHDEICIILSNQITDFFSTKYSWIW